MAAPLPVDSLEPLSMKLRVHWMSEVSHNGLSLQGAPDRILQSPTIVRTALMQNGMALQFVPKAYVTNEVLFTALKANGLALQFASSDAKDVPQFVNIAVKQNGLALKFASRRGRNNSGTVMIAVMNNGLALQYAGDETRGEEPVVLAAVRQNVKALRFAPRDMRRDALYNSEQGV